MSNKKKSKGLKSGVIVFVLITLVSLLLIFILDPSQGTVSNFKKVWNAFQNINPIYLVWTTLIVLISLFLSAYRIQLLTLGVDKKIKFWPAMRVVTGYEFLSAVTPFGSGGQPLEVWILKRNGISLGRGLVVAYFKTASVIFIFFVFAPISLLIYPEWLKGYTVPSFMIYGMIFPLYFVILTYLSIFKPKFAKKVTHRILNLLKRIKIMKTEKYFGTLKHAIKEINTFNLYIKEYFSGRLLLLLYIMFVTALNWGVRFMALFTIGLAFGIFINPAQVLLAQSLIFFVNYFVPTPGASGTSEMVALSIFKKMVSSKALVIMTLWRFFTFHLVVLLSTIPALRSLNMKEKCEHEAAQDIIREA